MIYFPRQYLSHRNIIRKFLWSLTHVIIKDSVNNKLSIISKLDKEKNRKVPNHNSIRAWNYNTNYTSSMIRSAMHFRTGKAQPFYFDQ